VCSVYDAYVVCVVYFSGIYTVYHLCSDIIYIYI